MVTNRSPESTSERMPLTALNTASKRPPTTTLRPSLNRSIICTIQPMTGTSSRASATLPNALPSLPPIFSAEFANLISPSLRTAQASGCDLPQAFHHTVHARLERGGGIGHGTLCLGGYRLHRRHVLGCGIGIRLCRVEGGLCDVLLLLRAGPDSLDIIPLGFGQPGIGTFVIFPAPASGRQGFSGKRLSPSLIS